MFYGSIPICLSRLRAASAFIMQTPDKSCTDGVLGTLLSLEQHILEERKIRVLPIAVSHHSGVPFSFLH